MLEETVNDDSNDKTGEEDKEDSLSKHSAIKKSCPECKHKVNM